MMKPITAFSILALALAGAACSQASEEATVTQASAPVVAQSASVSEAAATDDDMGGFNLMVPGEADTSDDLGGFNLSIPGDEGDDLGIPADVLTDDPLADLPSIEAPNVPLGTSPTDALKTEDDVIRLGD